MFIARAPSQHTNSLAPAHGDSLNTTSDFSFSLFKGGNRVCVEMSYGNPKMIFFFSGRGARGAEGVDSWSNPGDDSGCKPADTETLPLNAAHLIIGTPINDIISDNNPERLQS